MAFVCNHLHLRSEDPDNAAKFYVDNFGAEIVSTRPLSNTVSHQLELNRSAVADGIRRGRRRRTPFLVRRTHASDWTTSGFETDDIQGAFEKFKSTGANIICEPWTMPSGSQVMFVEAPDKVSLEIIQRPA